MENANGVVHSQWLAPFDCLVFRVYVRQGTKRTQIV